METWSCRGRLDDMASSALPTTEETSPEPSKGIPRRWRTGASKARRAQSKGRQQKGTGQENVDLAVKQAEVEALHNVHRDFLGLKRPQAGR